MNEKKQAKIRKNNMRLYPIYRSISADVVFFYVIKIIFLTQIRNINLSDIVLAESAYGLFMIVLQIPAILLIQKLGKKKCVCISNIFNAIYVLIIMMSTNLVQLLIAEFISALCFSLKNIAEPSLLTISIPQSKEKGKIFSRIEGKGSSHYFYLDAITAMLSGFLYAVNPYIPFIASATISIIAFIISLGFTEPTTKEEKPSAQIDEYLLKLRGGFHFIFNSKRMRGLLLFSGVMWGIFCVYSTCRTSLLQEMQITPEIIGILSAIFGIASGIGSRKQNVLHEKFKNRTLSVLALTVIIAGILSGMIVILKIPFEVAIVLVTIAFILVKGFYGSFNGLINRYLGNFSTPKIIDQIYTANGIVQNLFRVVVGSLAAWILSKTTTSIALLIFGTTFLLIILMVLSYMKDKVGLKPEEYQESDIKQ